MKSLKTILGIALSLGGLGTTAAVVGVSAASENAVRTSANGDTVTVYCAINTSSVQSYKMCLSACLSNNEKLWVNKDMTIVESGITYSGKNVYKASFEEKYGGIDQLYFKYYDGDKEIAYKLVVDKWITNSNFSNKVFTYENAINSDWASYSIPEGHYSIVGIGGDWDTDVPLTSEGSGKYSVTTTVNRGDEFKVRENNCWYNGYGYNNASGTASANFSDKDGGTNNNIYCSLTGSYKITFTPATPAFKFDYATDETYSYFLTSWSNYSCAYLYNSASDEYSEWSASPAVSSLGGDQAYNVKIGYNSKEFYGLYKISDRYLSSFSYLILKKSGDVSGGTYENQSVTFSLSGTQKVYIGENDTTPSSLANTSALYKAVDLVNEMVTQRGNATYDSFAFDYSICATNATKAAKLISDYETLMKNADAAAILNNSTLQAYDVSSKPYSEDKKTDVTIAQLVDALRMIVAKNSGGNGLNKMNASINKNNEFIIISVVISTILLSAAGAFFILRKKKFER